MVVCLAVARRDLMVVRVWQWQGEIRDELVMCAWQGKERFLVTCVWQCRVGLNTAYRDAGMGSCEQVFGAF